MRRSLHTDSSRFDAETQCRKKTIASPVRAACIARRSRSVAVCFATALFFLLTTTPSTAAVRVDVVNLTTRSDLGIQKSTFVPGEDIRYQGTINVLENSTGSFRLVLRLAGDGWYEAHEQEVIGTGFRTVNWGGDSDPLFTSTAVCEGKVSLLLDVIAGEGERVEVQGRRHGYVTIQCPSGRPAGIVTAEIDVGDIPFAMALTGDGRFLYVTSRESRTISVIDTDRAELVTEIPPDWEEIKERVRECQAQCPSGGAACRSRCREEIEPLGEPSGLTLSPDGTQMLVADYRRPVIHVVDSRTHTLQGEISLEAFWPTTLVEVAVNQNSEFNECFVLDYTEARAFRVGLAEPHEILEIRLDVLPATGLFATQIVFDPTVSNPFTKELFYVLAGGNVIRFHRTGAFLGRFGMPLGVPSWDMFFHVDNNLRLMYVVLSALVGDPTQPPVGPPDYTSYIYRWDFVPPIESEAFEIGSVLGDLVLREDGRYAYAIDSYRGEILLIDLERMEELRGCAIPVEGGVGGRHMLADPNGNRLYVDTWSPGSLLIIE